MFLSTLLSTLMKEVFWVLPLLIHQVLHMKAMTHRKFQSSCQITVSACCWERHMLLYFSSWVESTRSFAGLPTQKPWYCMVSTEVLNLFTGGAWLVPILVNTQFKHWNFEADASISFSLPSFRVMNSWCSDVHCAGDSRSMCRCNLLL